MKLTVLSILEFVLDELSEMVNNPPKNVGIFYRDYIEKQLLILENLIDLQDLEEDYLGQILIQRKKLDKELCLNGS